MNQGRTGGLLLGLQYLRFVAALMVVLCHAWQMAPIVGKGDLGSSFHGGASGVDLFFVISGFIMVYITAERPTGPGAFLLDRIARIAPPYWVITLFMAAVLLVAPSVFRSASFDTMTLITSLLFIPWPSLAVPGAAPLLQIGWTLNYEMFFYAIFALAMLVSRTWRVPIACAAIFLLISMQLVWPNNTHEIYQFYSSTIMIEFVFGMVLALLARRFRPDPRLLAAGFAVAIAAWIYSLSFDVGRLSQNRFLLWGFPAALIVACVVAIDMRGLVKRNSVLLLLGNASYAIYLTHLFPLGAVRWLWPKMPQFLQSSDIFLLSAGVTASLAVGIGFYVLVEKPLIALAKARLKRTRSQPARAVGRRAGGAQDLSGGAP